MSEKGGPPSRSRLWALRRLLHRRSHMGEIQDAAPSHCCVFSRNQTYNLASQKQIPKTSFIWASRAAQDQQEILRTHPRQRHSEEQVQRGTSQGASDHHLGLSYFPSQLGALRRPPTMLFITQVPLSWSKTDINMTLQLAPWTWVNFFWECQLNRQYHGHYVKIKMDI